nr:hypothetical protein BaRGS_008174 [Batillaria attramentaria]
MAASLVHKLAARELRVDGIVVLNTGDSLVALQRSFFSSTSSSGDTGSHSQSSESVIVHTNYARTLTYSVRRFALGSEELLDSPQLAEDEYDLAYRSILPAQVVWNKKPLNIIRTVKADMSLLKTFFPQITVLQMTFDIEHYMVEAIHNEAEWGQRYIAFCNYDLQILDVENFNVVIFSESTNSRGTKLGMLID